MPSVYKLARELPSNKAEVSLMHAPYPADRLCGNLAFSLSDTAPYMQVQAPGHVFLQQCQANLKWILKKHFQTEIPRYICASALATARRACCLARQPRNSHLGACMTTRSLRLRRQEQPASYARVPPQGPACHGTVTHGGQGWQDTARAAAHGLHARVQPRVSASAD